MRHTETNIPPNLSASKRIIARPFLPEVVNTLSRQGLHPLWARIYAARGISDISELSTESADLLPPSSLLNTGLAATLLADAIMNRKKICIVADYDCDGATACAVAVLALNMMGGQVSFLVPNRFDDGYGLTPAIADRAHRLHGADVLVTVDNGIASIEGVNAAVQKGMAVLITDHHLCGERLPENCVIVNPNHPDCAFESKNLAGVGVIFYVMLALRAELRNRGVFDEKSQPRLDSLLDLVALGTVADVVRLDKNNRILVAQGLRRIAAGNMQKGVAALFRAAKREWHGASAFDLGFVIAPRLNAAGRMEDMTQGVECLITDDAGIAWEIAENLNKINVERRDTGTEMQREADAMLEDFRPQENAAISVFEKSWHQGIIGILASRLKEKYFRPTFVFCEDKDGLVRGSGRSIPGFHLRDAIDLIAKRHPDIISRFGGHALAAGLTMRGNAIETFRAAFEKAAREQIGNTRFEQVIETDGTPDSSCYTLDFVSQSNARIWGQGFEPPLFSERFRVTSQRILKGAHLSMQLKKDGMTLPAIYFNHAEYLPNEAHLAFSIAGNEFRGKTSVQLLVRHAETP